MRDREPIEMRDIELPRQIATPPPQASCWRQVLGKIGHPQGEEARDAQSPAPSRN